jgi:hypothetical protein
MAANLRSSLKRSLRSSLKSSLSGGAAAPAPEATEWILTEDSDALMYEDSTFIYQET